MNNLKDLEKAISELQKLKDDGIPLFADGMLKAYSDLLPLVKKLTITQPLHSEPKTKDDMLLEILAPLGTEIPDPTGEYADLFAYLYDKISP
ncbi:MAG TPA: hypothetical protein GX708_23335, partial [Gallicola sp.]|nr:hypothetical protein [Gallicola sp.]